MSLILRYFDNDFDVREEFLASSNCKLGLYGKALSAKIIGNNVRVKARHK